MAAALVCMLISGTSGIARVEEAWWRVFDDKLLDSLETRAIEANYELGAAERRVAMAKDNLGAVRSGYYPQISISGGYERGLNSGRQTGRIGNGVKYGYWSVGAQAQWEIDVFGKIRSQVKEGKSNVKLSRAQMEGVQLSIEAQVALTYMQLRVQQAQLEVAIEHSNRQEEALKIAQARFETGLASMMDVDQAQQVYYSTRASIPLLHSSIAASINNICVLLADDSENLRKLLAVRKPIPPYVVPLPKNPDGRLLRRRPDVKEAEAEVDLYAARLGVSRKDWLPSLSITASAGTMAHDGRDLFGSQSWDWMVAPTLSWTVFDGLSRNYNIAAAREQLQAGVDSYNLTLMTAAAEVSNYMAQYKAYLEYISAMEKTVEASSQYDTRSLDNYKSGLSPYINVADAQMSFLQYVNSLLEAKGDALTALIDLYKALGGDPNGTAPDTD